MFGLLVHYIFLESLILHYLTYLQTNKTLIFLTDINCVYCFHFLKFAFILYLFYILILYLFYVYFFRYLIHSMEFRSMILETLSDKKEHSVPYAANFQQNTISVFSVRRIRMTCKILIFYFV